MLNDAILLITGAGKGIGEAVVLDLIQRKDHFPGLKLFLTSRTAIDLNRLKVLAESASIPCETLAVDLTESPTAALGACVSRFGRVDALIHSAGVGRFGSFLSLTREDLRFVLENNIEASFLLMQATYRQMKEQIPSGRLRGQIQWITSVAAEKPFAQSSIYCMSKFAQRGLIEVMRGLAYQDGIRILEVQPGATYTPMWGTVSPAMRAKMMAASEIARPMVDALLMSPESSIEVLKIRPLGGDL